jgi:DNA polymerase I
MAKDEGYVESLVGRRRPTPDVQSSNFAVREGAYRAAINMPIQGTAADLTKLAMVRVVKQLPEGARLIMQVHDSLLVECDESQAAEVGKILKEIMEAVYPNLGVKLKVDVSTGKNWGEL